VRSSGQRLSGRPYRPGHNSVVEDIGIDVDPEALDTGISKGTRSHRAASAGPWRAYLRGESAQRCKRRRGGTGAMKLAL
jgi:hypothetical protein